MLHHAQAGGSEPYERAIRVQGIEQAMQRIQDLEAQVLAAREIAAQAAQHHARTKDAVRVALEEGVAAALRVAQVRDMESRGRQAYYLCILNTRVRTVTIVEKVQPTHSTHSHAGGQ